MNCAVYIRVSSRDGEDRYSLTHQRKTLPQYARSRGWEPKIYDEGSLSAESIAARPVFQQLLGDLPGFGILLVVDFDRLCRSQEGMDWAIIVSAARDAKCLLATPTQELDPSRVDERLVLNLFGAFASYEKGKILERTARGKAESMDRGNWPGGPAPRGYVFGAAGLEVDPGEAAWVREVFRYPAGYRLTARHFNVDVDTVARIRRRPVYAGLLVDSTGRLIEGRWEPIIPREEWEEAQTGEPRRARSHMLSGLVRCAGCGRAGKYSRRNLSLACGSQSRDEYTCPRPGSMVSWQVQELVYHAVRHLDPVQLAGMILGGLPRGTAGLERDLERVDRARAGLLDLVASGEVTQREVRDRLQTLGRERLRLRADLRTAAHPAPGPDAGDVLAMLRLLPPEPQEDAIRAVVSRVLLDYRDRTVRVEWGLPLEPVTYRVRRLVGRGWTLERARQHVRNTSLTLSPP